MTALTERPAYFHGGAPGLSIGQWIMPRNSLRGWSAAITAYGGTLASHFGSDGTTISITSDVDIATAYAAEYVSPLNRRVDGALYRVEPDDPLRRDTDFPFSFSTIAIAPRAQIIDVVDARVRVQLNPRFLTRAIAHHKRMKGTGAAVYDDDGYLLPQIWLDYGATPQQLHALGPWFPLHLIPRTDRFTMPARIPPRI